MSAFPEEYLSLGNSLVGIDADVEIGCEDRGHSNRCPKISKGLNGFSIPRDRRSKCPHEIGREINDPRLIQTIEHVEPKLEASVFQAADAPYV